MDEKDFWYLFARNILLYPSNPIGGTTASFQLSQKEIQYCVCLCMYVCMCMHLPRGHTGDSHLLQILNYSHCCMERYKQSQ